MQKVKGCFVGGKDYQTNTKQNREIITTEGNKLKARHLQALLIV